MGLGIRIMGINPFGFLGLDRGGRIGRKRKKRRLPPRDKKGRFRRRRRKKK